jgi:hypothetical protein
MKKLLYGIILLSTSMYLSAQPIEQQEQSLLKKYSKGISTAQTMLEANNRVFTAFFLGLTLGYAVTKKLSLSVFICAPALGYAVLALTDFGMSAMDLPYMALGQESFAQDHPYIAKPLAWGPIIPLLGYMSNQKPIKLENVFIYGPIFIWGHLVFINAIRTIFNMPYYGTYYGLAGIKKVIELIDSKMIAENTMPDQIISLLKSNHLDEAYQLAKDNEVALAQLAGDERVKLLFAINKAHGVLTQAQTSPVARELSETDQLKLLMDLVQIINN